MGKPSKPRRLVPVQVTPAQAAAVDWLETFLIIQRARAAQQQVSDR